jgi:hypothetical protein
MKVFRNWMSIGARSGYFSLKIVRPASEREGGGNSRLAR